MFKHIKLSYEAARENTYPRNSSTNLNWFGKMCVSATLLFVLPIAFIIELGIKHGSN